MVTADLFKKVYLFENLTAEELSYLSKITKEVEFMGGDLIFDENSKADSLFIIKQGSVSIIKNAGDGDENLINEIPVGSHFGEMSFIDGTPRSTEARAKDNTKLLAISYADLEKMISEKPLIGMKLYKAMANVLSRRIRQTTNTLAALKELKLKHI